MRGDDRRGRTSPDRRTGAQMRAEADRRRVDHTRPSRALGRLETNPAIVRGLTVALSLLAAGGIGWAADVPPELIEVAAYVVGIVAPIVVALWIRPAVTANAKVVARVSTSTGSVVAGDAAALPTGSVVDDGATLVSGRPSLEVFVPVDPSLVYVPTTRRPTPQPPRPDLT